MGEGEGERGTTANLAAGSMDLVDRLHGVEVVHARIDANLVEHRHIGVLGPAEIRLYCPMNAGDGDVDVHPSFSSPNTNAWSKAAMAGET